MKRCGRLTLARVSAWFTIALISGCATTEAPQAVAVAPTIAKSDAAAKAPAANHDDEPDAADDDEADDEDEATDDEDGDEAGDEHSKRAARLDAGKSRLDGGDARAARQKRADSQHSADAGDAGDAGAVDCSGYKEENSVLDLFECDQFEVDDCDTYAVEVCQAFHFLMDKEVFAAFVECVAGTPGLDLCGEDQSTIKDCETEAKTQTKLCRTHQVGCEAYDGCESMSVDECDKAVTIYSTSAIETVSEFFGCDTDPTYFFSE